MEEALRADITETLLNHYGFSPEEVKTFLAENFERLLEQTYQAQTEHLLTAVNKR